MEGVVFIGAVVVAVVDAAKSLSPKINGYVSVVLAGLIGGLIALVDVELGVQNLSVAEGILAGLAASGTVGVAKRIG